MEVFFVLFSFPSFPEAFPLFCREKHGADPGPFLPALFLCLPFPPPPHAPDHGAPSDSQQHIPVRLSAPDPAPAAGIQRTENKRKDGRHALSSLAATLWFGIFPLSWFFPGGYRKLLHLSFRAFRLHSNFSGTDFP